MPDYLTNLLRRPPVGWWDLLDIAIVSILIYEFLKLIRGTRAVQMAVGSLLVIGLFYVSQLAPLQTLNWLIRNALVYVGFAAIVIFQSDIRRALAHFGQAPFFRYFNRQEAADETIEEVVVAATMLSQQKIGAIVAIEREIGLRNYIESGIPLDATLTYDLLVTIFRPGSPLHDGAVILQEGRVAAAACFLPLTVNPRLSRELGTRHRAAIGLTEESDAAAIVVSEETGLISVALNGEIERGLSPDAAARAAARTDSAAARDAVWRRRGADALSPLPAARARRCWRSRSRRCCGSRWRASTSSSVACACRSSSGTFRTRWRSSAMRPTALTFGCAGRRRC